MRETNLKGPEDPREPAKLKQTNKRETSMSVVMSDSMAKESAVISARMDRLPKWGVSLPAKAVFITAYFFAFYDIISIGVTLPSIAHSFHLKGASIALPLTTSLLGYIIGSIALGRTADKLGRRFALFLTMLILAVSSVACGLAWDIVSLAVFRLIVGMGIGAQVSLCATMINELSPSHQRGSNIQRYVIWAGIGDSVTPFIVMAFFSAGDIGWRLALAFGVVALIPGFLMLWLPESPRWLVTKGRNKQAEAIVQDMENRLTSQGVELPPPAPVKVAPVTAKTSAKILLAQPYLGRIVVVTLYWTLIYVAIYGFLGFETTLLNIMTIHKPQGVIYTALGDLAFPVGAALPLLLLGRVHRRILLFIGSLIFMVGLALVAISWSGVSMVIGAMIIALSILFIAGVGYTYTTEIFPTHVRAFAMGIADGGGHIGGVIAPYFVLAALSAWGARGAFGMMAGLVVICAFLILFLGTNRTEEMATQDFA